jgi:YjbR protein
MVTSDDDREGVSLDIVARIRYVCVGLPEAYEEQAWVGTRWRIRTRTFAHVLTVDSGWPPAYARAAGANGPMNVLMFRSSGPELDVLRNAGHPFFGPPWRADEVGMVLGSDIDWNEIAELLTESYCVLAPRRLVQAVDRPTETRLDEQSSAPTQIKRSMKRKLEPARNRSGGGR